MITISTAGYAYLALVLAASAYGIFLGESRSRTIGSILGRVALTAMAVGLYILGSFAVFLLYSILGHQIAMSVFRDDMPPTVRDTYDDHPHIITVVAVCVQMIIFAGFQLCR